MLDLTLKLTSIVLYLIVGGILIYLIVLIGIGLYKIMRKQIEEIKKGFKKSIITKPKKEDTKDKDECEECLKRKRALKNQSKK